MKFDVSSMYISDDQFASVVEPDPKLLLKALTTTQPKSQNGNYQFFLMCNIRDLKSSSHVFVGTQRSVLLRLKNECTEREVSSLLLAVVKALFIAEQREYLEIGVQYNVIFFYYHFLKLNRKTLRV